MHGRPGRSFRSRSTDIEPKCSADWETCREVRACLIRQSASATSLHFKIPEKDRYLAFDARDCRRWFVRDSVECRLQIYEDRIHGWFLDVETYLRPHGHFGFVVLATAVGQLEGLHQYRQGETTPQKKSGTFFREELKLLLAGQTSLTPSERNSVAELMYKAVRNGLFHDGMTTVRAALDPDQSIPFQLRGDRLIVNPYRFVENRPRASGALHMATWTQKYASP